jgi:hypothetical protein
MKLLIAIIIFAIILIACGLCISVASAEAPIMTLRVWRETKVWDAVKTEAMVRFVAREYEYKKPDTLVWLATKESSLGEDKGCGDNGKSCGLFQIRRPTWDGWAKQYNLANLELDNYVDQTIMTITALNDNQHCNWGPLRKVMNCPS